MHLDRIRPVQPVQLINEPLCKRRDSQHPLPHRAALHHKSPHLTFAIHHFLIRQHRAEFRAPIHRRVRDIRQPHAIHILSRERGHMLRAIRRRIQPRIVELQENPLRPFKIPGVRRIHLPLPVVAKTNRLQLPLKSRDICLRRRPRMLPRLNRVLLRRQPKRIPPHRMQHIEPAHPLKPPDDIRRRIALRMPHMQPRAARIREHIQHVVFRLRSIKARLPRIQDVKRLPLVPDALPARFKLVEWKWFAALSAHRNVGAGR